MTRWTLFLAGTGLILVLTVGFAALTARSVVDARAAVPRDRWGDPGAALGVTRLSLYANAALSQAVLLAALAAVVVIAGVSWSQLGLPGELGLAVAIGLGAAVGLGLAGVNHGLQRLLDAVDLGYDNSLRELLGPSTPGEWVVLLVVVLPVVAGFEELLFRGALIAGVEAGLAVSPWLLVVLSSVAFALGHGLQGPGGLLAAGVLGLLLGTAFVASGSLVVVVVAHYVVNAVEFLVHR